MTGIDRNHFVANDAVAPFCAHRHSRPHEHHGATCCEGLIITSGCHFSGQVRFFPKRQQFMLQREVTIKTDWQIGHA